MTKLKTVKEALNRNHYSCVIANGDDIVYTSFEKGVKPLMQFYNDQQRHKSLYVADKIIGKGAAFLLVLISAKALYTPVISESALALLEEHGIKVECDKIAPFIKNRTRDGRCPIESAVLDVNDPNQALDKIINKLKELSA